MRVSGNPGTIWNLRNLHLFKDLTPPELRELAPLLSTHHYPRGEFVFHMGEQADRLHFLEEGMIKLSVVSPDGRERILDIFRAGDTFGELFFGKDKRRMATAQALADATVRTMTEEAFMGLMRTRPDLCLNFIRHLVDQQRRTVARLDALMHLKSGLRLLAVLLDLAERCGECTNDNYALPETLTQTDVARMTGFDRSTVNGWINRYRRRRILGGHGSAIVVYRTRARELLKRAGLMLD